MRIASLVLLVVSVACGSLLAQQSPDTNGKSSQQPAASPSAKNLTVTGCVSGGTSRFTLSQKGTGAMFELRADRKQLTSAIGKVVEVTAAETAPTGTRGVNALPSLQVSQMHIVADKCPEQKTAAANSAGTGRSTNNPSTVETREFGAPGAVNQTPPAVGNNPTTWGNGAQGAPSPGTGNPPSSSSPPQ